MARCGVNGPVSARLIRQQSSAAASAMPRPASASSSASAPSFAAQPPQVVSSVSRSVGTRSRARPDHRRDLPAARHNARMTGRPAPRARRPRRRRSPRQRRLAGRGVHRRAGRRAGPGRDPVPALARRAPKRPEPVPVRGARLRRRGVRCVLPAGRLPWEPDPVDAATDVTNIELEQLRLAVALDRLAERPAKGHAAGARRPRLRCDARAPAGLTPALVRGCGPDRRHAALGRLVPPLLEGRRRSVRLPPPAGAVRPRDGRRGLRAKSLWQFSDRDYFIAPMSAIELAAHSSPDPTIEWYQADHAMRSAKARARRTTFLRENLRLT